MCYISMDADSENEKLNKEIKDVFEKKWYYYNQFKLYEKIHLNLENKLRDICKHNFEYDSVYNPEQKNIKCCTKCGTVNNILK